MGAPTEQYEQQSIEVLTPEIHVIAQADDPWLLWSAGVVVPIVLALIPYLIARHRRKADSAAVYHDEGQNDRKTRGPQA